jgi:hypothetical protein
MLSEDCKKIIYSKSLDHYQYRTLIRDPMKGTWSESVAERGPMINRARDRLFIVTAISQVYSSKDIDFPPQIILVVLKGGPTHQDVRVHVEYHHYVEPNDTALQEN